ncbi:tetratricopeptide repeat protein [Sphingomonas sp. DG1-23]|uniref:tetratricopeptide repeat protein n=1 Tax=Sphingomonas sp. DG1-23 TaxID=3068316 RepID=UPI00273DA236|nr:tetratricopeptide repeat protein [Sphingomonas sp. DG1-23]MDP5280851.1 tetratricopeptide repeat protein [Sphingomonas sp. DG1-23]
MRKLLIAFMASTMFTTAAQAGDKPVIGPVPAWVKPVAVPPAPAKPDDAAIKMLLWDQQVALETGRETIYSQVVLKIQTPQGLAAGNISFPWRPETDELTVHKLLIRRGDKVIDVLESGQTFTVLRRETNLESATLDGMLTANIQPEGLQVGDVIEFATSVSSSDPVMKGHVEHLAGGWNATPIGRMHMRIEWPADLRVQLRQSAGLPAFKPIQSGNRRIVEFSLDDVQPFNPPKGAPARYSLGGTVEATDFRSWADLGALLAPLFEKAATLPAQGPLRAELERIRAASADPERRAEAALALVQDRVRYVALAMGSGGLVPADAEVTWTRRYGDCKGKTALLLALLREMNIEAEPVAVSTVFGDGLDTRVPMVGLFNHVIVRARIAGKSFWLDGTRTGDASLDRLAVPDFSWGLPLVAKGAALVRLLPAPLDKPGHEVAIRIDATAGLTVPAPVTVETVMRGDAATATNLGLANLTGEVRERSLREYWKGEYDFIEPKSVAASFDPATGEQRLTMTGLARMDWSSGWYETDGTAIGYKADFGREPGPDSDAPFSVAHPYYTRVTETILLPPGFESARAGSQEDVDRTIAGIAYRRQARLMGNVFTIEKTERSIAPEFPASEAPAAEKALRDLAGKTVYLKRPAQYRLTEKEVAQTLDTMPTTVDGFLFRGNLLLDRARYDEAIADFDRALALDPKSALAFANRGIARVWKNDFPAATKDLDAAYALDPRNAVVFRGRGLMAQRNGTPKDAVAAYTAAIEIDPGNAFAFGSRAEAYRSVGDDAAALRDSAAALKLEPRWSTLYLLRANIFRRQGKTEEGLAEAAAISAAIPDQTYTHVTAAAIYNAFGKSDEAMKAYDRALAIKPEAFIYLNRSENRPKADKAGRKQDIEAALRLEPDSTDALATMAKLQADESDYRGAIATYSKALARQPDDAGLLSGRGIAYARAGDGKSADKDFAAAIKTAEPVALNNLCWAKATAGVALESALADCNGALAREPDIAGFLDSRALVYLRLGRVDEAIADYDRALAKSPNQTSSLFGRALAWARKGDKARSQTDADAAVRNEAGVGERFKGYGLELQPSIGTVE